MFIDRIIKAGHINSTAQLTNDPSQIINDLKNTVAVLVDNVSEYYYVASTQEYWDLEADFPNIAPPWPSVWFEWSPTEHIKSQKYGLIKNVNYGVIKKIGILMKTVEFAEYFLGLSDDDIEARIACEIASIKFKDPSREIRQEDFDSNVANYRRLLRQNKEYDNIIKDRKENIIRTVLKHKNEIKWIASFTAFVMVHKEIFLMPITSSFYITRDGKYKPFLQNKRHAFVSQPLVRQISHEEFHTYSDNLRLLLDVPMLSLCFANCKNVVLKEYTAPNNNKRRHKVKKGSRQFVKYHVLSIDPIKKVLNSTGKAMETGLRRAMHLCRGHFATYSETSPLFGKHVGTFWRPMHIRGQVDEGIVIKDYAVRANQEVSHGMV